MPLWWIFKVCTAKKKLKSLIMNHMEQKSSESALDQRMALYKSNQFFYKWSHDLLFSIGSAIHYWFSFVCKFLQPNMLPGKKLCCDSDWVSAIVHVTCMQSKRIWVFQGLQYYTTVLLCASGCTPWCCVFHHHVAVCFRVYTMLLCVSGCMPPCCVFQSVHHVVCFQVYTIMLCVSGCTPLCCCVSGWTPPCCVFQGVHHHAGVF